MKTFSTVSFKLADCLDYLSSVLEASVARTLIKEFSAKLAAKGLCLLSMYMCTRRADEVVASAYVQY